MKRELSVFLTAIMFYTRIPCPRWIDHSPEILSQSTKYFPLIGWTIGGFSATVYFLAQMVLPSSIAIILSMISSILLTGAFHEDGFADVCDGFGGGWTKSKILTIMKDSAIGAYGTIGILMMLLFKYALLVEIEQSTTSLILIFAMISGHSLSRTNAVLMIFTDTYARENEDSKAKPVAKRMNVGSFITAILVGIIPLILFQEKMIFLTIPVMLLLKLYFSRYFNKWINGYTGDCLGALQQVSEVAYYLNLLVIWKYT